MKRLPMAPVLLLVLFAFCFVAPGADASWLDTGPTIKTFYALAVGRAPTAAELENHLAALEGQKQNLLQIITALVDSKECQDRIKDWDPVELAYLKILGRCSDGEGHEHYLKRLNQEKVPIEEIEAEMANSDEGKKFAIRLIYWANLNRDADEPGYDHYLPSKYIPWTKADYANKKALVFRAKSYPDVDSSTKNSRERDRMAKQEPLARDTIKAFFKICLDREPAKDTLRLYVRKWFCGVTLYDILSEIMNSDEFKKRKLDEVQIAGIRHLLKSPDEGLLKPFREKAKTHGIDAAIQDMQYSDDGVRALIRKIYWQTFQREADSEGLKFWSDKFKSDGRGRDRYRDWLFDFFKNPETKEIRSLTQAWKAIADAQDELSDITTQAQSDYNGEWKKEFDEQKKDAEKAIADLKKVAPAEFASMTYLLDQTLAGIDLDKMKAVIDKLVKDVNALGPLLTGDVQKIFTELLGRPAPDFYALLNAKTPAWDTSDPIPGAKTPDTPGVPKVPGNPGASGVPPTPPATPPGTPGTNPALPVTPTNPQPPADVPGFEIQPGDDKLVAEVGKILSECRTAAEFKDRLIDYIVASKAFKDREDVRQQAVVSLFGQILQRAPTEKEAADFLAKLNTGRISLEDLRAEIEKTDEFQKIKEALIAGKIFPFLPEEKAKADQESKADDGAIKDKTVRLSDLEGFKDYDWAREVMITEVNKTEDSNGMALSGKASVPKFKVKDVKVFVKQHPSVYGYKVYIFGAFFPQHEIKSLYDKPSSAVQEFLNLLSLEKGVFMHSSADVVLQMDSLPDHIRKDFDELVAGTGYKSFRLVQGENLVGNLKLEAGNATKHLKKMLPDTSKNLLVQGRLAKDPSQIFLQANLPPFKPSFFPKDCKQVEPAIQFTGKPSVGVRLNLDVVLPEKQPMTAKITFEVPLKPEGAIQLAASLEGMWKDPFKIKGLTVGNLVLTGKITVPAMSPAFGLGGDFRFGEKIVRVAASIPLSVNLSSIGLLGAVNALGTKDLLALFQEMGGKIEKIPFPEDVIGFKDVEVSFSAQADPVLKIPEGVSVKGKLYLRSDEVAKIDAVVSKARGVVILGTVKKLDVGPLSLSGDGLDRKPNTADDGAVIDILCPYGDSHAYLNGRASIFGVGRDLKILVDRRGLGFSDRFKIFKSWESTVEVQGSTSLKKPDFNAKVEIKSDLAADLEKAVDDVTGGHTPGFVKKIFSNLFALRRAGFEANLSDTVVKGAIPSFWIEFAILGRSFNWNLDINLSDVKAAVKNMANKVGERVDERVREFVREYLKAIANFFKRLFGRRKGKIDDIMAKYRDNQSSYRDPDEAKWRAMAEDASWEYHWGIWSTGTHGNPGATVELQSDGNLVVYSKYGKALWASKTNGNPGATYKVQDDGNFVVLRKDGKCLWAAGTDRNPGATLKMQDDGNLVVYAKDGKPIWASQTSGNPGAKLVMQDDGNLVVYARERQALWASHTDGNPGARLEMQNDGNLVISNKAGKPIWASGTHGHPGAYNVMQSDGNYVIYYRK